MPTAKRHWWTGRVYPVVGIALASIGVVQVLSATVSGPLWLLLAAVVAGGTAVAVAGAAPMVALLLVLAVDAVTQLAVDTPPIFTFLATIVCVYQVARVSPRRDLLIAAGATLATLAGMDTVVSARHTDNPANIVIPIVYFGIAAGIGWLVRQRETALATARAYAATLEREREHLAALAAAAERNRLARELHDVISHGVSLMVLQAEAAQEVIAHSPDRAVQSLDAIGTAGRRAISDLRDLLGVLREPAMPGSLDELLAPVRAAGLAITVHGEPETVPPALWPTTYRLVQEALTNVLKHSGARTVSITVGECDGQTTIEVADDGHGPVPAGRSSTNGSGRGLAGMAERVEALGGRLTCGAGTPGGFRVWAELPR